MFREAGWWLAIAACGVFRLVAQRLDGIRFDPAAHLWQSMDYAWLRESPLESLYLMHMQPPLMNLLRAVALQAPGDTGDIALQGLFLVCSAVTVGVVYWLLRRFGFGQAFAGTMAVLWGVLPQTLIFENIFFYAHLEATLIAVATVCAARYLAERRLGFFVGLAACIAGLGLLRSMYHLGWIALTLLLIWFLAGRREGLRSACVAVCAIGLVTAVYVKNWIEFGSFASSSWLGPSIVGMLIVAPTEQEKFGDVARDMQARVDRGEFSPALAAGLAGKDIWTGWMAFAKGCEPDDRSRPVVCAIWSPGGALNFNHVSMIDYSNQLGRDAAKLLRLYPSLYLRHLASSVKIFIAQPSWNGIDGVVESASEGYRKFWNRLVLYQPERGGDPWMGNAFRQTSLPYALFVVTGLVVVVVLGLRDLHGYALGRRSTADWVFPLLVIALFVVVPNLINGRETSRMRYAIEPLLFVAVATAVGNLWRTALHGRFAGRGR